MNLLVLRLDLVPEPEAAFTHRPFRNPSGTSGRLVLNSSGCFRDSSGTFRILPTSLGSALVQQGRLRDFPLAGMLRYRHAGRQLAVLNPLAQGALRDAQPVGCFPQVHGFRIWSRKCFRGFRNYQEGIAGRTGRGKGDRQQVNSKMWKYEVRWRREKRYLEENDASIDDHSLEHLREYVALLKEARDLGDNRECPPLVTSQVSRGKIKTASGRLHWRNNEGGGVTFNDYRLSGRGVKTGRERGEGVKSAPGFG